MPNPSVNPARTSSSRTTIDGIDSGRTTTSRRRTANQAGRTLPISSVRWRLVAVARATDRTSGPKLNAESSKVAEAPPATQVARLRMTRATALASKAARRRRRGSIAGLRVTRRTCRPHPGERRSEDKKRARKARALQSLLQKNPGGVLLSHTASRAVPSAPRSLTSEFGMGSGVASSRTPPETCGSLSKRASRTDTVRTAPGKRDSRNPNPACESQMCLRDMTKPHGLLVPVSSANCFASTPGLSTSWSTRGL